MPFIPYMADMIYTNITGEESVHLANWPDSNPVTEEDKKLIGLMQKVRNICELGNAERKKLGLAVKQPLASITVKGDYLQLKDETDLLQLIKEELNVEDVFLEIGNDTVEFDTVITADLKDKGIMREIIRNIQGARKEAGCSLNEKVEVYLPDWPVRFEEDIKRKALVSKLTKGPELKVVRS